jgi:hypothetical protein
MLFLMLTRAAFPARQRQALRALLVALTSLARDIAGLPRGETLATAVALLLISPRSRPHLTCSAEIFRSEKRAAKSERGSSGSE